MKKFLVFGILLGFILRTGELCAYELKVMSFNIKRGGLGRLPAIIEFIKRENPDIVGIQEADFSLKKIATKLDYHFDHLSSILSRFPIVEKVKKRGLKKRDGVLIQIPKEVSGKEKEIIGFFNVHLPPYPYTPYLVRDGKKPFEKHRLRELKKVMKKVSSKEFNFDETSVFLVGDLNTVSHIDWEGTLHPTKLPVTTMLETEGFKDSYRTLFPNAITHPGNTWTPNPFKPSKETSDRIDYIFFKGPLDVLTASVHDGPVGEYPWPSDHRAVTATFSL